MVKEAMDFTEGSISKKLFQFIIPVLGTLVLQTLYGVADILVVGRFGNDVGISAVSSGSTLINMVVFIVCGLAMGITVVMNRYIVLRDRERLAKVAGNAMVVFFLIALVLTVLLICFAPGLVQLMQVPRIAKEETIGYIRICGSGIIFIVGYNVFGSILRGMGHPGSPLIAVAVANAVNIVADLLFVAVFGWNVAGAAFATVISQAAGVLIAIITCLRVRFPFRLSRKDFSLSKEVKNIMKVGLPIAFQEFLTQISLISLLMIVNGMGTTEMERLISSSGYGIANKVVALVMLVPSALMQTMSVFIAQNVRVGKERRAQKAMGYGMLAGCTIGILMTAAAFFGGHALASLFTGRVVFQNRAAEYLQGFSLEAIVTSILFSFVGYYNGHNRTKFVMLQGVAQTFIIRLPMAFIVSKMLPDSLAYIGAASPLATLLGIAVNVIYFLPYSKHEMVRTGELEMSG